MDLGLVLPGFKVCFAELSAKFFGFWSVMKSFLSANNLILHPFFDDNVR